MWGLQSEMLQGTFFTFPSFTFLQFMLEFMRDKSNHLCNKGIWERILILFRFVTEVSPVQAECVRLVVGSGKCALWLYVTIRSWIFEVVGTCGLCWPIPDAELEISWLTYLLHVGPLHSNLPSSISSVRLFFSFLMVSRTRLVDPAASLSNDLSTLINVGGQPGVRYF